MSALGQEQTSRHLRVMSALPPKADIPEGDAVGGQKRNHREAFGPPGDFPPSPESLLRLDEYIRRLRLSASMVCPMPK